MTGRSKRFLLACSLVAALAVWGAPTLLAATGDPDDNISPAKTAFKINLKTGTTSTLSATVGGVPVTSTCQTSADTGKTPATGLTAFTIGRPAFSNCTDNLGGTDTVTTSGTWTMSFKDAANDEAGELPGDKLTLNVPIGGATLTSSAASGCVITLAPVKKVSLTAAYDDVSTAKFTNAKVPFSASAGCPGGATTGTASFNATYVSTPGFKDIS